MRFIRHPFRPALLGGALAVLFAAGVPAAGKVRDASAEELVKHPELLDARERVAASPNDAGLHNDLGNLYARAGWDDLAIAEYRQATVLDPRMYVAWTNLGTLYAKGGELGRAKSAFQTAIRIQPRAALAHYNLGVVLDREGAYDEAIESYVTAVRYQPDLLDPGVNPPVVQNKRLLEVKTLLYMKEVGSAALPLEKSPAPVAAKAESKPSQSPAHGGESPSSPAPVLLAASAAGKTLAPEAPSPVAAAQGSAADSTAAHAEQPGAPPVGIDPRSGKKILGTLEMKRTRKSPAPGSAPVEAPTEGGKTASPSGS